MNRVKIIASTCVIILLCATNTASAQTTTTRTTGGFTVQHNDPNNEVLCRIPGTEYLPQCQAIAANYAARQSDSQNPQNERATHFNSQNVDQGTVRDYRPLKIIEIPDQFVKPDWPPYWMRICRPVDPSRGPSDYVTPISAASDGGTPTQINDRGCTYVPFTKNLILTTSYGSHEVEYQFLGRN